MRTYIAWLIMGWLAITSCKKEHVEQGESHPLAGTVRLYETKRNWKLKYYDSGTNAQFSLSIGTNELIEFLPGKEKNQYFIRQKDNPLLCIDAQAKNDSYIKLYSFFNSESQLFNIIDVGSNKIKIQSVVDTSLYLLNNSDNASFSYSSYLKPNSYDINALDFWVIEKL